VLGEIENSGLIENAVKRGNEIRDAIVALGSPLVAELRGSGLLIGVGLTEPVAQRISAKALDLGLIVNAPNDDSIRIAPPLTIGDREVAEFTALFASALEASA